MNEKISKKRNLVYWLSRGLRVVIPIVILYVIFKRLDIDTFKLNIANSNPWLVAIGIGSLPLAILIGGSRWYILLKQYNEYKVKLKLVLKHYWIGLTLGYFTPASLGWEAYRVAVSGRWSGQYTLNTAVIFVEKMIGLISCALIIAVIYPMAPFTVTTEIKHVIFWVYILLFVSVILIVIVNVALRNRVLSILLNRLEDYFSGLWRKMSTRLDLGDKARNAKIPVVAMIKPLTVPKNVLSVSILSFGIYFVCAVIDQIFFRALGYPIPFIANLFVTPFIFFVFSLPISFGSFGIREGAYIIFYGMFGVPAEIALLVSFFNLSGVLLNNLIGGFIMMFSNFKRKEISEITFQRKRKI